MKEFIAIVPIKYNSQRVPGKNLKLFGGEPLCLKILRTLGKVRAVTKIIVDTDSAVIADTVKQLAGVDISFRPQHLRGDSVSVNLLIEHVMNLFPKNDCFIQTHATNPLLEAATITKAIDVFNNANRYDSLFTVNRFQSRFYKKDSTPINHNPGELIPTQDLSPLYEENSNLYIFSRTSFKTTNARIGINPFLFEMNKIESIDIDEPEDFLLAETVFKLKKTDE